ncbi:MAG: hypothetical protein PHQ40_12795, partial [Anaerolineaceae bacterium]|nr:hypothetical protein [Anaerolineaceae bacterium]
WTFGNSWRVAAGKPSAYEPVGPYKIRLVKVPDATWGASTLRLRVNRYPLADLTFYDTPEIPDRFQENLLHGMSFVAYHKWDADTENLDRAAFFFSQFIAYFGPAISHKDRIEQLKRGEQEMEMKRAGSTAAWKPLRTPPPQPAQAAES